VNYWMKEVRELSYDMEDSVDQFVLADSESDARMAFADEISGFGTRVEEVIERYHRYKLGYVLRCPTVTNAAAFPRLRRASEDINRVALVGIECQINELLRWLKPNNGRELKVVSILGVDQGVGRSTLAQKLWRESETEFGTCRAFVLMARKPDIRMTLGSILSQIRPLEAPGDYTVPYLTHDIRTHLQDKRLLLGPTRCLICSTSQCIYSLLVCLVKKSMSVFFNFIDKFYD